jgi:hypothetical protein
MIALAAAPLLGCGDAERSPAAGRRSTGGSMASCFWQIMVEELVPRAHGLAPGVHTVEARAHDDTEWVRLERTALQQVVTWHVEILP